MCEGSKRAEGNLEDSRAAVHGEKDYDTEFRILQPDGTVKVLKADGMVVRDTAGKALRMIGINCDITERKRAEEQIRYLQKAESLSRMDGWETLAALRELSPGIPVILSSGHNEAQVMDGDHPTLPEVFLSKPYGFKELREAIARVLADKKEFR